MDSALKQRQCGKSYITRGWRSFCSANGLKAGDIFTFKLIKRGGTLLLRKSPSHRESKEDEGSEAEEIESLSTESDSDEESNQDEKALKRRIFIISFRVYHLKNQIVLSLNIIYIY